MEFESQEMLGGRPMQQMGDARKECFAVRDPSYQQATEPLAPVRGVLFVGYPAPQIGVAARPVGGQRLRIRSIKITLI